MKFFIMFFIVLVLVSCSDVSTSNNDKCKNPCFEKKVYCEGNYLYSCNLDENGCFVKSVIENCKDSGKTCDVSLKECVVTKCQNECDFPGAYCKDDNTVIVCGQFDEDSCYEYGDEKTCNNSETCKNGECVLKATSCYQDSDCGENNKATCVNKKCSCPKGFIYDSTDKRCNDINECVIGTDDCTQNCENKEGGFTCSCNSGYTLNTDGKTCIDINECASQTDNCTQNCENKEGGFTCSCNSGYTLNADGKTCDDIDECANNTDNCDSNATCSNKNGGFTCVCNSGYSGDGVTCTDIDDCANNPCIHGSCTDTGVNSYLCSCEAGWEGVNCNADINECANNSLNNCDTNATCHNIYSGGGFRCVCNSGYSGDGVTCTDIDDCANNPCIHGLCTDTGVNSYSCACEAGWKGRNCNSDINECTNNTDNCNINATCHNNNGGFTCICNSGYSGDGINCVDINECTNNTDNCNINATCHNTDGSFTCSCNRGYHGDGIICNEECGDGVKTPSEECDDGNNNNHDACLNTCFNSYCGDGFIRTNSSTQNEECDDGNLYLGDGCDNVCNQEDGWSCDNSSPTVCTDIDECANNTDNCTNVQYCQNTEGGFNCFSCGCNMNNTVNNDNVCQDGTGQCNCLPMYEGRTCNVLRKLKIYVTNNIYNGNLGGVIGGDDKCNIDSNQPDEHYYKALLGSNSRSLTDNWVLEVNMPYYRFVDMHKIGTTDTNKWFIFDLDEKVINNDFKAWTGLRQDGNVADLENCKNWTKIKYANIDIPGKVGKTNSKNREFVDKDNNKCKEFRHLYCIEQVCPNGQIYDISNTNVNDSTHGICQ